MQGNACRKLAERAKSVDFVGGLGVIGDEALEDAHNLVTSERHGRRRAVEWMSFDPSRPGHSAGEGACYDFGDRGHFAISIFPVRSCRYDGSGTRGPLLSHHG